VLAFPVASDPSRAARCADEPVELLQLAGVPYEHILGDQVEILGGVVSAGQRAARLIRGGG
jgi:hypothetical protein